MQEKGPLEVDLPAEGLEASQKVPQLRRQEGIKTGHGLVELFGRDALWSRRFTGFGLGASSIFGGRDENPPVEI